MVESMAVGGEGPSEAQTLHTLPLSNVGIAHAPMRMQSTAGPFSDGVLQCFFTMYKNTIYLETDESTYCMITWSHTSRINTSGHQNIRKWSIKHADR